MTLARRLRSVIPVQRHNGKASSYVVASAVAVGALAAMALVNRHLAKKAERDNPAAGRFLDVDGVRCTTLRGAQAITKRVVKAAKSAVRKAKKAVKT